MSWRFLCLFLFGSFFQTILFLPSAFARQSQSTEVFSLDPDPDRSCRIPFEKMWDPRSGNGSELNSSSSSSLTSTSDFSFSSQGHFQLQDAINPDMSLSEHLRNRYIVADFNTTDEKGACRGVQEYYSDSEEWTDFVHLQQLKKLEAQSAPYREIQEYTALHSSELRDEKQDHENFERQVLRFYKPPVSKSPVHAGYLKGKNLRFCIGQTLNYCEIIDGRPRLVFRFITSSSRAIPPSPGYYAPINAINTRHWSSDRSYRVDDFDRDSRLGGGDRQIAMFHNGGRPIEMPNFLNFLPLPGFKGETQNGIHEIAGGLDSGGTFGAPVSLGCVRLTDYAAKLSRWWTPMGARFFIFFEPDRYRQRAGR